MKNLLLIILFTVLNTSCAHKIILSTRTCKGNGIISDIGPKEDFKLTSNVSAYFTDQSVYLKEIFDESNIDCEQIEKMEIIVQKDWTDFLLSLLPFYERVTFVFRGTLKNEVLFNEQL